MPYLRTICIILILNTTLLWGQETDGATWETKNSWARYFEPVKQEGTIVIEDHRPKSAGGYVYNPERAQRRLSPASTFKLAHALFALDAGVLQDDKQIIPWDGKKRFHPPWNQDQTLSSSIQNSTVWVYEHFAHQIGNAEEFRYLKKTAYGNQDAGGDAPFWIQGHLRISALEQVNFLKRLYHDKLPFSKEHQHMVKQAMGLNAGIRAKPGWNGKIGWWVGWVETPDGPIFFALNINTPKGQADLPLRKSIPRAILSSMGIPE